MILFDRNNCSFLVNDPSRIKELISKGYTTKPRQSPAPAITKKVLESSTSQEPSQNFEDKNSEGKDSSNELTLNVNTASLNQLKSLDGVGIAKGKTIIENQPNLSLAELIEAVPDIDWTEPTVDGEPVTLIF